MRVSIYVDPLTEKTFSRTAKLLKAYPVVEKPKTYDEISKKRLYEKGLRVILVENDDGSLSDNVWINKNQIDMNNVEDVLKNCTIEGNVVKLPEGQLDRKTYLDTKNKLEKIGGKWKGGKIAGFVFESDPSELLGRVAGGENVNLKKEFQFFETPAELADYLVELSGLKDRPEDCEVCEPNAGRGAIIRAIQRLFPNQFVWAIELMDANRDFLRTLPGVSLYEEPDFLKTKGQFDIIIANPPFSKNQDIDHVTHMYECLEPEGRLVSVVSNHWINVNNSKEVAFQEWLAEVGASVHEVAEGTFKKSGTMVASSILVIDKP